LFERGAGGERDRFVLEASTAVATRLVDHLLGGDGTRAEHTPLAALDELSLGALAYLAARVAGSFAPGFALHGALREPRELEHALGPETPCVILPITLRIAEHDAVLRALLPSGLVSDLAPRETSPVSAPRWLDAATVMLSAQAGHATLACSIVRALAVGDVIVLDGSSLAQRRGQHDFAGSVELRVLGGRCVRQASTRDRELVIEPRTSGEDTAMSTGKIITHDATPHGGTLAGDTPIELRAELARFSVTLGELSRLQPGDVLVTGRRIGEHVTLLSGTRALAEGELVDVEGELGVRVLRLLEGEPRAQ
jgi:type III secretion system YscQ/HrcQ family protein